MIQKDSATLSPPSKLFFPKRDEAPLVEPPLVLDMGEASRLEGFRQNGCR